MDNHRKHVKQILHKWWGGINGAKNESQSDIGHFSRNAQSRMSLPIMQQNKMRRQAYNQLQRRGQQVAQSMGFVYLQHKGETKQANLPNELTTLDTIRALFVCAFPHMLTMEFMSQPNIKIYIYSPSCNIFYELSDIDEVRHESVLRIHFSDPLLPIALPAQVSPMAGLGAQMPGLHPHQYSTLRRLPPRPQPQVILPQQPGSRSSLGQPIQQAHMMPQMTSVNSTLHRLTPRSPPQVLVPQQPGSRSSLGQPIQQAHMMPQMARAMHQMMNVSTMGPQLSQIPPPKPPRMIPASYTMHRLNSARQ